METVHPNLHCQQEQHTFQATMNFKWISANKCKFILTCQLFVLLLLIPPTKFLLRSTTNATTCQPDKFGIPSNVLFCIARYQADFSEPSPTHANQPVVRPDLRNLESSLALLAGAMGTHANQELALSADSCDFRLVANFIYRRNDMRLMDKLLVVVGRHAFRKAAGWLAGCRSSCTFRAYELWALEWEGINQNLLQSSFSSHHITHRHPQFRRIKLYNDPEGTQCYTFNLQSTHSRCQRNGAEVHGYGEGKIRRRRDLKKEQLQT